MNPSATARRPRIHGFDADAIAAELASMASLAKMEPPASLARDLSAFAGIARRTALARPGAALRDAHAVRIRFSMERLREYRTQAQDGDDAACHRLRNTIEILAASMRRAVAMLGEGPAVAAVTPGEAVRSRAA